MIIKIYDSADEFNEVVFIHHFNLIADVIAYKTGTNDYFIVRCKYLNMSGYILTFGMLLQLIWRMYCMEKEKHQCNLK